MFSIKYLLIELDRFYQSFFRLIGHWTERISICKDGLEDNTLTGNIIFLLKVILGIYYGQLNYFLDYIP